MLQMPRMLSEITLLTKATSKYLLSPLTRRKKNIFYLIQRTRGKQTSNIAMRIAVSQVLSTGFSDSKKLLRIHLNLTLILKWDIVHYVRHFNEVLLGTLEWKQWDDA